MPNNDEVAESLSDAGPGPHLARLLRLNHHLPMLPVVLVYAIGATLIFATSGLNPQLREISSFGYGNSWIGGRDDRLVFGLGATAMPQSLRVRWPSTAEKVYDLSSLDASHFSDYSNPVVITEL